MSFSKSFPSFLRWSLLKKKNTAKGKEAFQGKFVVIVDGILGDPGADSGDEGKSKRAEKCGAKKSKERREEPLGAMSYQTRKCLCLCPSAMSVESLHTSDM